MKKIFAMLLFVMAHQWLIAQSVGIGTTTPNPSAQLDVTSTTKGMLVPRMTDAEKNAILSPVQGLMVFNITTNSFQYYNGVSWVNISHSGIINGTANKVAKFTSPWGLTANTLITDNGNGVAINTTNALPNSSALLDMASNNKGVLIPRMATAQRTVIAAPATGLLVFDNTTNSFWFYNGSLWTELTSGNGSSKWNLSGANISNSNTGNVGIGTNSPYNKLDVTGSLLVTAPTSATSTPPTVAQTKTLPGLGTITFLSSDSTGRLYDPGGPAGNYGIDLDSKANIPSSSNIGFEVIIETMDLNTGDSLIIKESSTGATLPAVGNVYNTTGRWVFNSPSLYINFKSNIDFNTGAGFSLLFRRLYDNSSSLPDVSGFTGKALFFNTKNGAFRSGYLDNSVQGFYSTAMGYQTTASGSYSTAMGRITTASGVESTAMGHFTNASGEASTAMGDATTASGFVSTAMGYGTIANGSYSTAIGYGTEASGGRSIATGFATTASGYISTAMGDFTTASGDYSTAMGNRVSTNGQEGCFIIGDRSTTSTVMTSPAPNNFRARFANGYRLYTSANYSTGCSLNAGDNAWTTGSDVNTKENFADVNGEDFLKKIAGLSLTSWNYKTQNPKTFRHYGPMAQDFYAAFGKDKYGTIGNDTTINSADFAGVSFIAIQALEKRTAVQQQELEQNINALKKETEASKAIIQNQQKQIDELKALVKSSAGQQHLIELMQKEIELLKRK